MPIYGQANQTLKVMVVDDDVLVRLSISDEFRRAGFDVVEAGSGSEAVGILESGQTIDAIFSAVRMSGMIDGLALAQVVFKQYDRIFVILTSGSLVARDQALRAQVAFISKPYWAERVVAVMSASLANREAWAAVT